MVPLLFASNFVSKYFEEKNQPIKKLAEGLLMHIGISTLCPS